MGKRKLKKQSSTQEQPEYTFFTDRDLGHKFPDILREAGLNVEIHDDHFPPNTPDVEWLSIVGKKKWIVLSHNKKIRRVSYEIEASMLAKARCIFIIGTLPFPEHAENFVDAKHKIFRFLSKHDYPFLAKFHRPPANKTNKTGSIDMWVTEKEWEKESKK